MALTYKNEKILNVPNIISFYRLIMFPVVFILAVTGKEQWFIVLFCINLVSDVIDGFIARNFGLVTKFGAAIDNIADIGTYILAVMGLFIFRWEPIKPHAWMLFMFFAVFVLSYIVAFIRFGKIPGLHIYSSVIAGYLQGVFFFVLFVFDFYLWFFAFAMLWGTLAYIEKIIILLYLDDIRPGVKGLYWLMKEKRSS